MKCKSKNEKECTHIYNIRKNISSKAWRIDYWGQLNPFQVPMQIPPLHTPQSCIFQIHTCNIERKSQQLELTTLKKNNIIEDGSHSFINHCATKCECYRMPSSKGKVVEQISLWMIVSLLLI
jgi:hypothetical protein